MKRRPLIHEGVPAAGRPRRGFARVLNGAVASIGLCAGLGGRRPAGRRAPR